MRVFAKVAFILLLFISGHGFALDAKTFYAADTIAKSQSTEDRISAIRDALAIVLGRLTSGDNIQQYEAIQTLMANASEYVQEYRYLPDDSASEKENTPRKMAVFFDGEALYDALQAGQLPVWSHKRLPVLVWLLVEEKGAAQFYDPEIMTEIGSALQNASQDRGIPLLFPLLDLEEQQQVSIQGIVSNDETILTQASAPYSVESVIVAKLVKTGGCWTADWRLHYANTVKQWSQQCGELDAAIAAGMQQVYGLLFSHYTDKPVVPVAAEAVLRVADINGLSAEKQVIDYLNSLSLIDAINELRVEAGYYLYTIQYKGDIQQLAHQIEQGGVLKAAGESKQGAGVFDYRYIPKNKSKNKQE